MLAWRLGLKLFGLFWFRGSGFDGSRFKKDFGDCRRRVLDVGFQGGVLRGRSFGFGPPFRRLCKGLSLMVIFDVW